MVSGGCGINGRELTGSALTVSRPP